ncbi:1-acyl-sn-glycerol-3-phosphate acyltransferase alpha-like [Symsagittifera roscoffensis]|uniref:1-acyl-sn-glycerol-3-phosphate acyltransferase alpha-like n=1 Tax=Symsagittifera roscoffensis TaxID=84072 RepID=UPI00307B6B88
MLLYYCLYFLALIFFLVVVLKTRLKFHFIYFVSYSLFLNVILGFGCFGMFILGLIRPRNPDNCAGAVWMLRSCRLFLQWPFKVEVRGRENIPSDHSFILMPNHQSLFDSYFLSYVWPKRCVPMMKKSLLYMTGIFGITSWLNGSVFIDRQDRASSISTCNKCVEMVTDKKIRIVVFPEGTRNMKGSHLLPFKKGAFHMAKQCGGIKLMPVVVSTLQPRLKDGSFRLVPGKVIVSVLPAIETTDKSVDELVKDSYYKMDSEFEKLNKEID